MASHVPWLLGGSADLAPSTNTLLKFEDVGDFEAGRYAGRNLHFGVREHAMGAICNGLCLTGLRPYGATFFVFTDYMRPSIRLAAIMGLPVFYVFTHDSIGVGEDGPTHEPVEHLAALRAIPELWVIRPADANEVAEAYRTVLPLRDQPAALILTRQNLPTLDRNKYASASGLRRGGYVLADPADGNPEVILIATGSEVALCAAAHEELSAEGIRSRVVSMPCWELFDAQPAEYRDCGPAAGRNAPHGRRARRKAGMGEVHRPLRPISRPAEFRPVGPLRPFADALRFHRRQYRGRSQAASGDIASLGSPARDLLLTVLPRCCQLVPRRPPEWQRREQHPSDLAGQPGGTHQSSVGYRRVPVEPAKHQPREVGHVQP